VGAPGPSGRCPETSNGHVHPQRRNVQLARERVSAFAERRHPAFDSKHIGVFLDNVLDHFASAWGGRAECR
jgi:hypothetical protein